MESTSRRFDLINHGGDIITNRIFRGESDAINLRSKMKIKMPIGTLIESKMFQSDSPADRRWTDGSFIRFVF